MRVCAGANIIGYFDSRAILITDELDGDSGARPRIGTRAEAAWDDSWAMRNEHHCEALAQEVGFTILKLSTGYWELSRKGGPRVGYLVTFCPFCGGRLE